MAFTLKDIEERLKKGTIRGFVDSRGEGKPEKKKNKYGAKKVELDGIMFDSVKESKRYLELRARKAAGKIKYLEVHLPFELKVGDKVIAVYESDFVYEEDGKMIVEDVKSASTRRIRTYIMKKKLMKELLNIEIIEV